MFTCSAQVVAEGLLISAAIVEVDNLTLPELTACVFNLAPTHCFFSDVKKSPNAVMM